MRRRGFPARLVIALSVAAVLAVFLLYTSIAGGGTRAVRPSQLAANPGHVELVGRVVGHVSGDAMGKGLHFRLRDVDGTTTVPVVYYGSVPDMFELGRDLTVTGSLRHGVFVSDRGSMITKCPSKYTPAKNST